MPKKIDDVIVPEKRRSIRDIPIPESRRKVSVNRPSTDGMKRVSSKVEEIKEEYSSIPPQRPPMPRHSARRSKRVWVAGLAAVAVLALATLSLFDRAVLSYVPRSSNMAFNNEVYSAAKTGENELLYSVVKLSGDKGKSVAVSGEKDVTRPASGTIIVYNDTSAEPQKLVENTRFESAAGKVYRIRTAITIPGKKTVAGVSQPGSIEAMVYADQPGESYNSAPTDFTVPGLKGTPRYTTIYARSKGALTGGFAGKEKVVSEADMLKARSELRTALTEELVAKAQAEVPDDFILFQSLSSVSFEDLPQSSSPEAGTANVNLRGHLYGIMFKRQDLAKELAKTKTAILANEVVDLDSYESLKLSFSGTPPTEVLPLNKISFKVEGSAKLVWKTDEVALKSDLLGRGKKDLSSVLKNYPTVASADATLRPFWKTEFPKEAEKITIKKLKAE
jgi:hypothetical protein